ncbi:MAG: ribosome small subunit-dependent GTPase A [Bacteroidota bacterium]
MKLEDLGYTSFLNDYRIENDLAGFDVGRVVVEHKDRYVVKSDNSEYECELIGNLRYNAESRADLPAVGDWVAISAYDTDKALIHAIYPRHSIMERQAVGKTGQKQIIATNIDYGLIVLAVNRDFNINRVERYLTICNASKVSPVILLNKVDLIDNKAMDALLDQLKDRIKNVPILAISNYSQKGIAELKKIIHFGKTYCLLGSSGVGKSSLINTLSDQEVMQTGEISESIDRGRHVTSHRELILLKNGGIIIDNPGMREVGITSSTCGLEMTFDDIYALAKDCRFNDCTHTTEKDCAVLDALENGDLDQELYYNFQKMVREQERFEISEHERRRKRKNASKMIRRVIKNKHGDG